MPNNTIEMIETIPDIHSKKCKIIAFLIKIFLQYTTVVLALAVWYLYDYFTAFFTLVSAFVIMGIIRSKLKNTSIPPAQREYPHNDKTIANWFVARELCIGDYDD